MTIKDRGVAAYDLLMQNFKKQPCIENARPVFLACQEYNVPIPGFLLDIIVEHFKIEELVQKEHDKWKKTELKRIVAYSEKRWPKEKILSCALRTDTPQEAFELYKKEEDEKRKKDSKYQVATTAPNSLWQRLDRFLNDELPPLIESQIIPYHDSPEVVIKKGLNDKLAIYKELIGLIC